jgi:hypothetical protein
MDAKEGTDAADDSRPGRVRSGYLGEIHLEMVALLAVILVVLVGVGWSLRPQSSGFPRVPEDLSLAVTGGGFTAVGETLTATGVDGAELDVTASGTTGTPGPWILTIGNLGAGRVCSLTPGTHAISVGGGPVLQEPVAPWQVSHPYAATIGGPVMIPTNVTSRGNMDVRLCWSSGAPVRRNGSFLSAQLPPLSSEDAFLQNLKPDQGLSLSRTLDPADGEVANLTVQSPIAPTSSFATSWTWSDKVPSMDPIRVSVVDISGTQRDSYRAFLAGICLGIAGGALIAIFQELVAPLSRRRDARHPV